jgi:arginase
MDRAMAVIGAPSSLGIRPYDDGVARYLDRAPGVLRQRGVIRRLRATDLGDVAPAPYTDYIRPPGRPRNEQQVLLYSRTLAHRVAAATAGGRFALVLGGDCSIVLGCVLGARRSAGGPVGLVYLDAHADFATPQESRTGSVASMGLALAAGRGNTPLAHLAGRAPLVDARHVALIGRRDAADVSCGHAALEVSGVLDLTDAELMTQPFEAVAARSLQRVASDAVSGFWIQLDVDLLNPAVMPAVDSPEPGGLLLDELERLLIPLVGHPRAVGMSLTVYDPALDPERRCARRLIDLLERIFGTRHQPVH